MNCLFAYRRMGRLAEHLARDPALHREDLLACKSSNQNHSVLDRISSAYIAGHS
jgi:hypothetical protein